VGPPAPPTGVVTITDGASVGSVTVTAPGPC
jgi:hypothetical protein